VTSPEKLGAERWDAVVVGTGFGGSMVALQLARAGLRVLLLERGRWVDRDDSAWDPRAILVDRKYRSATPVAVAGTTLRYPDELVGGNSVVYGAASLRMREADFTMGSLLSTATRPERAFVDWPIRYADLEPYYGEAEQLLSVAGVAGQDPTEPPRHGSYPDTPAPYSSPARAMADAAAARGLHPFPLPLAINFGGRGGRARCIQCLTCDLFPCKIGAKNDLAVTVLPEAIRRGAVVRPRTIAERLLVEHGRVAGVACVDADTRERFTVRADGYVVSAGAIASPALLLRSGLGALEPNGRLIGRHLMRHCSGIVVGLLMRRANPERSFHKQVAITDFYFGPAGTPPDAGCEWWGTIQGLQVPPAEYFTSQAPFPIGQIGAATLERHLYALCLAHDEPNPDNRVALHPTRRDPYGLEVAQVFHRYSARDRRARRGLYREASRVLRQAGAWLRLRKHIATFSHAVGSCRMGDDPAHAVLDPWCRVWGVPNLYVVDGSFMPTSGAVSPSLTIAANALRVGAHLAANWSTVLGRTKSP
jgi:choline dehydrogenase-like flavoprotein